MSSNMSVSKARLICVTPPNEEQLKGFEEFVCTKTGEKSCELEIVIDESIIGGFIIQIGNEQYDRSLRRKFSEIKDSVSAETKNNIQTDAEQIISVIREDVKSFEFDSSAEEIGTVVSVGDSIATISGLDSVMYGEIIIFESGIKGMIQDIKKDSVGCILFGSEDEVSEGLNVRRTRKKAGVPVGEGFIGRIVNSLGEPIVDRKSVSKPLETGILAIDSMFPIGRGQRELIIGDRQTGKTSIALDTILNQKGKDCICIYNAIGQKASTVAKLVSDLEKHGAMEYTIVVCSTASDPASLQYISPYSATAIAE